MEKEQKPLMTKIFEIQQSMQPVKRNGKGYKYTYATLPQIWEKVAPEMKKLGIGWTATSKGSLQGDETMGLQVMEEMKVTIFNVDNPKDSLSNMYLFPATTAQVVGSYETYYRRYALIKILGIVVEDESDDDGAKTKTTPKPQLTQEFE